jgi:hypothetical protein
MEEVMSKSCSCLPRRSLTAVALLLFARALAAQSPGPAPTTAQVAPPPATRFSASIDALVVGASIGGPSQEIEDAMWGAGLNDPGDGGMFGSEDVSYPRTHEFPQRLGVGPAVHVVDVDTDVAVTVPLSHGFVGTGVGFRF